MSGTQIRQVYIAGALRTPQATKSKPAKHWYMPWTGKPGKLSGVHPVDLGVTVVDALALRAGLKDRTAIKKLTFGCAAQTGEQGGDIGGDIAKIALSPKVSGNTVNFLCGSSMQAMWDLEAHIAKGDFDLAVAGGVESMSPERVGMGSDFLPPPISLRNMLKVLTQGAKAAKRTRHPKHPLVPMGVSAGLIADQYKLTSRELNQFTIDSHEKAHRAREEGRFAREIVAVETGKGRVFDQDDGIRLSNHGTLERLPQKWGIVTPAHASLESDGAAALLLASEDALNTYGLEPRAEIIAIEDSADVAGGEELQLTATIDAVEKVLRKANLTINDIDLFEINEAFAPVVLATAEGAKIPLSKTNVNGGALALGHPLGASGARLVVTLLHELERQDLNIGLAVLCIGRGRAIAAIIKRVD